MSGNRLYLVCAILLVFGEVCHGTVLAEIEVEGSLRLRGKASMMYGKHFYEGRVEIYHDGQWGTICYESGDASKIRNFGDVACYQLGYDSGYSNTESSTLGSVETAGFGQGTGPIWLSNVVCQTSEEELLIDCDHPGWGVHNCDHSQDLWLACSTSNELAILAAENFAIHAAILDQTGRLTTSSMPWLFDFDKEWWIVGLFLANVVVVVFAVCISAYCRASKYQPVKADDPEDVDV